MKNESGHTPLDAPETAAQSLEHLLHRFDTNGSIQKVELFAWISCDAAQLLEQHKEMLAALEAVKAEYESSLAPDELNFKEYKMICAAISKARVQSCPA